MPASTLKLVLCSFAIANALAASQLFHVNVDTEIMGPAESLLYSASCHLSGSSASGIARDCGTLQPSPFLPSFTETSATASFNEVVASAQFYGELASPDESRNFIGFSSASASANFTRKVGRSGSGFVEVVAYEISNSVGIGVNEKSFTVNGNPINGTMVPELIAVDFTEPIVFDLRANTSIDIDGLNQIGFGIQSIRYLDSNLNVIVPEPSTWAMLCIGLIGLLARKYNLVGLIAVTLLARDVQVTRDAGAHNKPLNRSY